jgi:hypothetical protein
MRPALARCVGLASHPPRYGEIGRQELQAEGDALEPVRVVGLS